MFKKTTSFLLSFFWLYTAAGQVIPADSIHTIDGGSISLTQYAGKKIMIVLVPATFTEADHQILLQTNTLYKQFMDSIEFIGVPSYERGYADSLSNEIKNWFRDSLQLGFTITTGMYTGSTGGIQQSYLFKWLTTASLNGHFETDTGSNWQTFLLNEAGELKAVFDANTPLDIRLIHRILQSQ
jgi:glutathione peroxidase-family protein